MSKIQLPNVTLFIADCVSLNRAIKTLEICQREIEFGDVKLLTSIPSKHPNVVKVKPLNSLIAYSVFMACRSHEYIDTEKFLCVQADGFIVNPQSWKEEWLSYDYLSPIFIQYCRVGSGGFSLRSKALMEAVSKSLPEWDWTQKEAERIQNLMGVYEDGYCSLGGFSEQFNIATPEVACEFSQGGYPDPTYYRSNAFGFHGTFANIQHESGFISPVCGCSNFPECGHNKDHVEFLQSLNK